MCYRVGDMLMQKMQESKKDDFSLNQLARKRFRVSEAVHSASVSPSLRSGCLSLPPPGGEGCDQGRHG